MLPLNVMTAKIDNFRAPTTRILYGERLKDVQQIQLSITKHGLLNPIKVMRQGKKLVVIDGKKRLAALRRMRFAGSLPRSLVNVPYVIANETTPKFATQMSLLSNREKFDEALSLRKQGHALMEIADMLYVSKQCVKDLLSVSRLSPRLQQAYFGGSISIDQAKAFAILPNADAQDMLLVALGPFANAPDILTAIQNGETVIDMGDDNVIILPSRQAPDTLPLAA